MGWAVMSNPDSPVLHASGVIQTPPMDKDNRSALWVELGVLLGSWLPTIGGGTANDLGRAVNLVAYERVHRHTGVHAAHLYGGQVALIQATCHTLGVPWTPVQVGQVKRFLNCRAVGRGKERAMVDAAHALGYNTVTDHNEADAVGIALAGLDAWKTGTNVFGNWKGS